MAEQMQVQRLRNAGHLPVALNNLLDTACREWPEPPSLDSRCLRVPVSTWVCSTNSLSHLAHEQNKRLIALHSTHTLYFRWVGPVGWLACCLFRFCDQLQLSRRDCPTPQTAWGETRQSQSPRATCLPKKFSGPSTIHMLFRGKIQNQILKIADVILDADRRHEYHLR